MATGTDGIATVADVLSISGVKVTGSYTSSQCVKYSDIKATQPFGKCDIYFDLDVTGENMETKVYVQIDVPAEQEQVMSRNLDGTARNDRSDWYTYNTYMPILPKSIKDQGGYNLYVKCTYLDLDQSHMSGLAIRVYDSRTSNTSKITKYLYSQGGTINIQLDDYMKYDYAPTDYGILSWYTCLVVRITPTD